MNYDQVDEELAELFKGITYIQRLNINVGSLDDRLSNMITNELTYAHLPSKVGNRINTAPAKPITVAYIEEEGNKLVLIDGYLRVDALPNLNSSIEVDQYNIKTLKHALFLRADLNLAGSRCMSKFEAVRLLVKAFESDIANKSLGGRGNVSKEEGTFDNRLTAKYNRLNWKPQLTEKDVKSGRSILSRMNEQTMNTRLQSLIDKHLMGNYDDDKKALSTFYREFLQKPRKNKQVSDDVDSGLFDEECGDDESSDDADEDEEDEAMLEAMPDEEEENESESDDEDPALNMTSSQEESEDVVDAEAEKQSRKRRKNLRLLNGSSGGAASKTQTNPTKRKTSSRSSSQQKSKAYLKRQKLLKTSEDFLGQKNQSDNAIYQQIDAMTEIVQTQLQNANLQQKKIGLKHIVRLVTELGTNWTIEQAIGCFQRSVATNQSVATTPMTVVRSRSRAEVTMAPREDVAFSSMTSPTSWLVVDNFDTIKRFLEACLDPQVYSGLESKLRSSSSMLCCRVLANGLIQPWTVTGESSIAIDTNDDGLFYVGPTGLKVNDEIGVYDGKQLGPETAFNNEPLGHYVMRQVCCPKVEEWTSEIQSACCENSEDYNPNVPIDIYVDGNGGVCGAMHKMNDGQHIGISIAQRKTNNVKLCEDGMCRVIQVIEPGIELTTSYNLEKKSHPRTKRRKRLTKGNSDDDRSNITKTKNDLSHRIELGQHSESKDDDEQNLGSIADDVDMNNEVQNQSIFDQVEFNHNGYAIVNYDADEIDDIWRYKNLSTWELMAGEIHVDHQRHRCQSNIGNTDLDRLARAFSSIEDNYEIARPCFIFTKPGFARALKVQHAHRDYHPNSNYQGHGFVIAAFDEPIYAYIWPQSHLVNIADGDIATYIEDHPPQRISLNKGQALVGHALLLHAGAAGDCPPRFHCFLRPKTNSIGVTRRSQRKSPLTNGIPDGQQT